MLAALLVIFVCCLLIISLGAGVFAFTQFQGSTGAPPVLAGTLPPELDMPVDESSEGDAGPIAAGTAAPEATPTGVRRLELAATPTPFYTTIEDDPRAILDLANPDRFDYFNDPEDWYDYDSPGYSAYWFEDGVLYGKDYDPEDNYIYWSYNSFQSGNTYAEVSATNGDCIGKDAVGMVIRIDPDRTPSGYAIEVSCDGSWRFLRHRQGKHPEPLIDWTPAEEINSGAGAVNRLGLWGYLGKFYMFVNGYPVGEFYDSNYRDTYGYFANYVQAAQTYDLTAGFDDFAFWHIPFIPE